jgi:hypothetical protein
VYGALVFGWRVAFGLGVCILLIRRYIPGRSFLVVTASVEGDPRRSASQRT